MNARELTLEYRRLSLIDKEAAKQFREANRDNELFTSILELHDKIVPAMAKSLKEHGESIDAARAEDDPTIRTAMIDSVMEVVKQEVLEQLDLKDDK